MGPGPFGLFTVQYLSDKAFCTVCWFHMRLEIALKLKKEKKKTIPIVNCIFHI